MEPAAVYVRISSDLAGDALGVARQEADCRALAARRGWTVAEVFRENDTSAFKRRRVPMPDGTTALRVVRPEYRRMLDGLASGRLGAVVAYDLDRVARDVRDLEDLIDIVEERKIPTASVTGSLDLSNDAGIFTARLMVNVANKSSRDTARRVRRKLQENAEAGRHHGGSRPYGWQDDRRTLDPDEAEWVRYAVRRVLDGASMRTIISEVTEGGAKNSLGQPWRDVTLRSTLVRHRNAGLRIHHGEVLGKGDWERILDKDTLDKVRRVLLDPRRNVNPGSRSRAHLLSGIATCGVCGAPMRVAKGKPYTSRKPPYETTVKDIYRCQSTDRNKAGCTSRDLEMVDRWVTEIVLGRFAQPDVLAEWTAAQEDGDGPAAKARADAEDLRARLNGAADMYASGQITGDQLIRITNDLRPQLEKLDAAAVPALPMIGAVADLASADDTRATWESFDVRQRRDIIRLFLASVTVHKTRPGRGFDPASVEVVWR